MENTNDENHLIDLHEKHTREDAEEEESFEDVNENTIYGEERKTLKPNMGDHSVTGLVASFTPLFKQTTTFNTLL